MFEFDFLAVVDGGSHGNGVANQGYSFYVLSTRDGRKQTVRLDLGTATNSEAEYQVLSAALKDLSIRIQRAGKSPSGYSLLVHTGSHLMVGQLTQGWKIKAANPLTGSGHACAPWPTRQPPSSRRLATVIPRLRSEEAWSRWPGSIALEVWTLCLGR